MWNGVVSSHVKSRDNFGYFVDDREETPTYYFQPSLGWVDATGLALSPNGTMTVMSPFKGSQIFRQKPDLYTNFSSRADTPLGIKILNGRFASTPSKYYTEFNIIFRPWKIFQAIGSYYQDLPIGSAFTLGLDVETLLGWVPDSSFHWQVAAIEIDTHVDETGIDLIDERLHPGENIYQDAGVYSKKGKQQPLNSQFRTLFQTIISFIKKAEAIIKPDDEEYGINIRIRFLYWSVSTAFKSGTGNFNFDIDYSWNWAPLDPLDFQTAVKLVPGLAPVATFSFGEQGDELETSSLDFVVVDHE